jgi:hypothetical protein
LSRPRRSRRPIEFPRRPRIQPKSASTSRTCSHPESHSGVWGQSQKLSQSIGQSPIDCESFWRAPIVNKAPRSERLFTFGASGRLRRPTPQTPRERSGVQITASPVKLTGFKSPNLHSPSQTPHGIPVHCILLNIGSAFAHT